MTKDFETLLYLFGDSAFGRKSSITNIETPDSIVDIAVKQGIWSCIYPMLDEICDVKKYYFDFLALVSKSIARNEFTLNVFDEAMKKGIKVCILKGVALASLYANPDYRISSDTDILIDKKDEKKMAKFFRPPEGAFSKTTFDDCEKLGYKCVFWSFAYADWDNNAQKNPKWAKEKILSNMHNGCVLLLHPNSKTNADILKDVIKELKSEGYTFETLEHLSAYKESTNKPKPRQ